MLLVNLYGVPGASKSSGTAYVFSQLKFKGINCEMALEFAKDKVWEGSVETFRNQVYILGKQCFRLSKLENKVDVAITDSPLLLSTFYNKDEIIKDGIHHLICDLYKKYDNMNYLVYRVKPYNPAGRFQSENESDALYVPMKQLLDSEPISGDYKEIPGTLEAYDTMVDDILKKLGRL